MELPEPAVPAAPARPLTETEVVERRDRTIRAAINGYVRPLTEDELMPHLPREAWPSLEARREALQNVLDRLRLRGHVRRNPDGRWERV